MGKSAKHKRFMQNWLRQMLRKLGSNWASIALMFGLFWGGYEVGCRHEENKKNLEHQRIESEQQERQQSEVFELRERIFNLEQDLRDCEYERKYNGKKGAEISKGDK